MVGGAEVDIEDELSVLRLNVSIGATNRFRPHMSKTISNERPYLETLSSGSNFDFSKFPLHRKLLRQPITIPDLTHLEISNPRIAGGGTTNVMKERYANYNGQVTNKLRNLIRKVPQALRTDYRKASKEASLQRYHSSKAGRSARRMASRRPSSVESMTPSEASRLEHEYNQDDEEFDDEGSYYDGGDEDQDADVEDLR
jgi:hypothetical protein